jgi:hypothetical protein
MRVVQYYNNKDIQLEELPIKSIEPIKPLVESNSAPFAQRSHGMVPQAQSTSIDWP